MKLINHFSAIISLAFLCTFISCRKEEKQSPQPIKPAISVMNQPTYRLFPTENIWSFIKLNTINGKMWRVQYSVKGFQYRFEDELNAESLLNATDKQIIGRFTLIKTSNLWNFILLDQVGGRTWQVQWSPDKDKNMVIPISSAEVTAMQNGLGGLE